MNNVIVGSGISGLFAGLLLSEKGRKVTIIEKEEQIGGLLKSYNYGDFGVFDYGMHNFLETGIEEIDNMIFDLLPIDQWNILEGDKRDVAGIYFNGKIQFNSPYIDIRDFKIDQVNDLQKHFANSEISKHNLPRNAKEYTEIRFGKELSEITTNIALEKIFQKPSDELDVGAIHFTPLSRLVTSNEKQTLEYYKSDFLRERIAFPEQKNLPVELSSGRRGYYPKQFGIFRIVKAIKEKILKNGGDILTSSSLENVTIINDKIQKLKILHNNEVKELNNINTLIWTANIFGLGNVLNYSFKGLKYDRPLKTYVVNILVDQETKLGDLYYFFCYDKGFKTFRLTNYSAYCKSAKRDGLYPLSLELLVDPSEDLSEEMIEKIAKKELLKFNILHEETRVVFMKAEVLVSGIPMLTLNNSISMKLTRDKIKDENISNLILTGILSEDNLFFQTDVLKDIYNKIFKL
jgi:protoporphyrinogen oxidase